MKTLSLLLTFFALSASAQASTIYGSWTTPCTSEDGASYRSHAVFEASGTVTTTETIYADPSCSMAVETETTEGTFKINSDSASATVLTVVPKVLQDGEAAEMKVQFSYSANGKSAVMKIVALSVIYEGQKIEIPAEQLEEIPTMTYLKD